MRRICIQILRINGLTLTTTSTEKKETIATYLFILRVWSSSFLYIQSVWRYQMLFTFVWKDTWNSWTIFLFFPISCFWPRKQELYLINSLNVIIYHYWQENSSTCVGANFRTVKDHEKKTEIISDQKSTLPGRSRFRFLFVVVDVYMERKSRFLRAKNALVECFLYL